MPRASAQFQIEADHERAFSYLIRQDWKWIYLNHGSQPPSVSIRGHVRITYTDRKGVILGTQNMGQGGYPRYQKLMYQETKRRGILTIFSRTSLFVLYPPSDRTVSKYFRYRRCPAPSNRISIAEVSTGHGIAHA
eukprot:217883-Rhodomonas_salina.1